MNVAHRTVTVCTLLLATAAAPAALTAQEPEPAVAVRDAAPTFHDAWLTEVLDRDLDSSGRIYIRVAADPGQPRQQRALALARLADRAATAGDGARERSYLRRVDRLLGATREPRAAESTTATAALRRALALPPGAERETALQAARSRLQEDFDASVLHGRSHASATADLVAERRRLDLARLRDEINAARSRGDHAAEREARREFLSLVVSRAGDDVRAAFRARRIRLLEKLADGEIDAVEELWKRVSGHVRDDLRAFRPDDRAALTAGLESLADRADRADLSQQEREVTSRLAAQLRDDLEAGRQARVARVLGLIPIAER